MSAPRPVFFVSDGTGITAETIGNSLLTQFPDVAFATQRLPFIDTEAKAIHAAQRIRETAERIGLRPIVVNTVVDSAISAALAESGALMMDVFAPFILPLETELGSTRRPSVGRAHSMTDYDKYESRINATNYALSHDDGVAPHYEEADVILVGVSRSGKTPTCLYMAMQFGIRAANYPLTEEDMERLQLPAALKPYKHKLFGLTIDPDRLTAIRHERKPNSRYASFAQCEFEVREVENLFRREGLPFINSTHFSVEEISAKILVEKGVERRLK